MTKQNIIQYENLMADAAEEYKVEVEHHTHAVRIQTGLMDSDFASITKVRVNPNGAVEYYLDFWDYGWYDRDQSKVASILEGCTEEYFDILIEIIKEKVERIKLDKAVRRAIIATAKVQETAEAGKAIAHKRMLELSRPVVVTQVGMSKFMD